MRASTQIVSGCFFGATIEPGTFHRQNPGDVSPIIPPDTASDAEMIDASPSNRISGDGDVTLH